MGFPNFGHCVQAQRDAALHANAKAATPKG
jgi:hypothetical protein